VKRLARNVYVSVAIEQRDACVNRHIMHLAEDQGRNRTKNLELTETERKKKREERRRNGAEEKRREESRREATREEMRREKGGVVHKYCYVLCIGR
jgi:hypothetical protein